MANQIATFFEVESGPQNAPADVATHLVKYWDPRMRSEIIAHVRAGGEGLSEPARKAVLKLAADSETAAAA
jgi:formate dehydrogenase subunit delta